MNFLLLLRQKFKLTKPRIPRITQAGFIRFTKKSLATYLIVFIAFSGTTGLFLFNPFGTKTADAAWFNDNWSYRQVATVTVTSSASDITDLQTILTIDTSTLITAGKLQSSCQDLRFTSQSGKILPYYIDSGCNTASTKVWVLADLVPKNTTTYLVYMYYGNPSAIAGSGTFPNFNLVQGLAGYWTGNESSWNGTSGEVKDSSVNGNNGTATGGLSTTTGKYGNSGDWDSTDDAISLGSPSAVDNLPANGMTFSAWIYPDSLGQSNVGFITAKNNGSSQNAGWIIHVLTSNSILFVVDGSTDLVVQTSTSAFTTSAWNHVVLSWAGDITSASSVDIYVNGVEATYVTQTNGASRVDDASSSLYIGNSSASNRTFDGKIDDYRLYNRAFSAAEVVQLYQNPGSITTTATTTSNPSTSFASEKKGPSPVAYWKLDEAQGSTAEDSTSNNLDGTLNNTPTYSTEDLCIAGKCLFFDGANNENVSLADDAKVDFNTGVHFTVSAWIKKIGTSSANEVILQKSSANIGSTYTGYKLYMDASGDLCFAIQDGTMAVDSACTSGVDFDDSSWHFVSGVKNEDLSITLYVDGVQRAQDASLVSIEDLSNATALRIGVDSDGLSNDFFGYIDEVKIYRDNTARTAAQITADYNSRSNADGVSGALGTNTQNMPAALSNGLVGYWKMDESSWTNNCSTTSVVDSSGNGSNGAACPNSTGPTGGNAGKFGNAGQFDGSNDYVEIADTSTLRITGDITISAWIKPTAVAATFQRIVSKMNDSNNAVGPYSFFLNINQLRYIRGNGTTNLDAFNSTGTVTAGVWTHIAVSQKGSTIEFYINGQSAGTSTATSAGSYSDSGSPMRIGSLNSGVQPFEGTIDETRIYNRALSGAEVSQLYNFAPGPVGYWKMDEPSWNGTANEVKDSSGFGNNGTGAGSITTSTGKYGKAGSYDGTTQYLDMGNPSSLNLTNALTITAWIKSNKSGYQYIVQKWEVAAGSDSYHFALDSNNYPVFITSTNGNYDAARQLTGTKAITDNLWHHVAATYDGTNSKIYTDGVLVGTLASSGTIFTTSSNFRVGSLSGTSLGVNRFGGLIDETKIYNYARTQEQIVEDMNAGHPAPGSPVGSAVAYWKFDQGADNMCTGGTNDACNSGSSGSTLDGAASGFASPATSTSGWTQSGKFAKALVFDGSNDYVSVADNSAIDFTGDMTVSFWIKPGSSQVSSSTIMSKHSTSTGGFSIEQSSTNTNQYFFTWGTGSTFECTGLSNTVTLTADVWQHVAFSKSGTTADRYVNGIKTGSCTGTSATIATNTDNFNIGRWSSGASRYFSGTLDEIKLFNTALTADQIILDANAASTQVLGALGSNTTAGAAQAQSQEYCVPGSSATCTSPNMRLTFEEGYGTTANDITGNANSGSLSGTPAWDLGKFGKGLAFDASDDIVTVSGLANDFFTGSWTQELWIKTTQTGNKVLTEKGSNNAFIQTNSGQIRAGTVSGDVYDTTGTPLVTDGTWHHIAVTYDTSTNLTTTYIDGVVRGTKTAASDAASSATAFALGSRVGLSAMYQGQMDDVRVYNYARSAAQIAWEYNKGLPLAQYNLDECQGTTLNNSISSSFAGTLTVGGSGSSTTVGTCTTSGAWFNGVSGKRNYSISLDGTDDYVTLANASSFPANNASQTMAAWLYYPTTPGSTATAISLVNTGSSSITAMQVRSGNIGVFKWGGTSLASTTQPAQATWNHVVYTFDGTTHSLYLNGRLANTSTTAANSATPNAAYFGDYTASGGEYWPGQIDDVRIYNYPLTAAQALLLYNDGAARYGPVTGAP